MPPKALLPLDELREEATRREPEWFNRASNFLSVNGGEPSVSFRGLLSPSELFRLFPTPSDSF